MPYTSGVPVIQTHKWSNKGTYIIKAKAKDINGEESDWGTLTVIITRTRASSYLWYEWLLERFLLLERLLTLVR